MSKRDPNSSASIGWLKALFGSRQDTAEVGAEADAAASPQEADTRAMEEARFLELLEASTGEPTASELRAMMSASYRAQRYPECSILLGIYEQRGFLPTDFTKRTRDLLDKRGVVDLRRLLDQPGEGPGAQSPRVALPQDRAYTMPADTSAFAHLADLVVELGTRGKLALEPLGMSRASDITTDEVGRQVLALPGDFAFVVVTIPMDTGVEGGLLASIGGMDETERVRHVLRTRQIDGATFATCAFRAGSAERSTIKVDAEQAAAIGLRLADARIAHCHENAMADLVEKLSGQLDNEMLVGSAVPVPEGLGGGALTEWAQSVLASAYSRQVAPLLLAASLERAADSLPATGWRRTIASWLLEQDASGALLYAVASALIYRFRDLRTPAVLARVALRSQQKPLSLERRSRLADFAGRAVMLDRQPVVPERQSPAFEPRPSTALYCLHQARPLDSNGYAVRSHALLKAIGASDWSVVGVTRPGYGTDGEREWQYEGVSYRALRGPDINRVSDWAYIHEATREMDGVIERERPAIIHAASSHANAWPALLAARRAGLPFVYEIRGFWEMSLGAKEPWAARSEAAQLIAANDTRLSQAADAVLVLTQPMLEELVRRGVDRSKIKVVPNAVDPADFPEKSNDRSLLAELGLDPDLPTVGYVGSVVAYEGLVLLVEALREVKAKGGRFNLLIVGDGADLERVGKAIEDAGLSASSLLTGRVPRERANELYGMIDICPFPRMPLPVSEHVSPLKPFEAMAQGKAVIGSDVEAIREFIADGENGRLFHKGDASSLASVIGDLLDDREQAVRLGRQAREWVFEHRTWEKTAAVVLDTYRALADTANAEGGAEREMGQPATLVTHATPLPALSVPGGDWFTVAGRAVPATYSETASRIEFRLSNMVMDEPIFVSSQAALAAGWTLNEKQQVLTSTPEIGRDGDYRFRAWLPAGQEDVQFEWAPTSHDAFYATGAPSISWDEPVANRTIDRRLRIAIIADKFTTAALSDVADCVPIERAGYRDQIERGEFDLFLCESAWEGNGGEWRRGVGYYSEEEAADLREVVETCRRHDIPTVFFNKEDPVHFDRFKRTAALFDKVVTTDLGMVPSYLQLADSAIKQANGRPFFANPAVHHPFGDTERANDFCYAGTYYGKRYADRTSQLDPMLDAAAETGNLVIYDRHAEIEDSPYALPARLKPFSRGSIDYGEMLVAYRRHGTFLNANSVPDSQTMFSRRVVEALSSGAAVLTAKSDAIRSQLHGRVPETEDAMQTHLLVNRIDRSPDLRRYFARTGMREVLRELTVTQWLRDVARSVGLEWAVDCDVPSYSVSVPARALDDEAALLSLLDALATQSHQPAWIKVTRGDRTLSDSLERKVARLSRATGVAIDLNDQDVGPDVDFHVEVDPDKWYGATCFEDMLVLVAFGEAAAIVARTDAQDRIYRGAPDVGGDFRLEHRHGSKAASIVAAPTCFAEAGPSAEGRKLLIAGHDLKFMTPFTERFEEAGFEVLIDQWSGHSRHDEGKSRELLDQADIVFCEWMLGNGEWYARNVRAHQPLIGRLHGQEVRTPYPKRVDRRRFDRIFYVSDPIMQKAHEAFGWQRQGGDIVIGNGVDMAGLAKEKVQDARFTLGFVGYVPSSKRIDRALDILAHLRARDPRFSLRVRGRKPSEYRWLADRPDEMRFYDRFWDRIKHDPLLAGAVRLDGHGADMDEWYRRIGFALSTSEHESFHFTVADGAASGAVPIMLPWPGADQIYSDAWISPNEREASNRIYDLAIDEEAWRDAGEAARQEIDERYGLDQVADRMIQQMLQCVRPRGT